jgi:hypothetical protein
MLKKIIRLLFDTLSTVFIIIYLILEEIIWERIAEPVYQFIHGLKLLQKVEVKIHAFNRYALLGIFLFLFALVEILGLIAIGLFAGGQVIPAAALYAGKIPIAAFTFWLFRIAQDKLMTFSWFKWCYDGLQAILLRIKTSAIYGKIKAKIHTIKNWFQGLKLREQMRRIKSALGF